MTQDELKNKLAEMRLLAMSDMRAMATAEASYLTACGHRGKTNAEAVFAQFLFHDKKIEKFLHDWEKANPPR